MMPLFCALTNTKCLSGTWRTKKFWEDSKNTKATTVSEKEKEYILCRLHVWDTQLRWSDRQMTHFQSKVTAEHLPSLTPQRPTEHRSEDCKQSCPDTGAHSHAAMQHRQQEGNTSLCTGPWEEKKPLGRNKMLQLKPDRRDSTQKSGMSPKGASRLQFLILSLLLRSPRQKQHWYIMKSLSSGTYQYSSWDQLRRAHKHMGVFPYYFQGKSAQAWIPLAQGRYRDLCAAHKLW